MIKIIGIWNGSISGEFTTIIDLYNNLKKYIKVSFYLSVKKELISNCIKHLIQNNNSELLTNITLEQNFESETIICTSFVLYTTIQIKSNNLFILDTLDLIKNDYVLPKINNSNITFFSNPANITDKIPYNQIEYYHKFNETRLNNLPTYYRPNLYERKIELLLSNILNYNRTTKPFIEIKPGIFFENIGKRIFEHLYHGKIVNYSNQGLIKPDGLFYYLKLFNIDGFKTSYNLNISEQIIKEKLFMNKDDILLNLIKDL